MVSYNPFLSFYSRHKEMEGSEFMYSMYSCLYATSFEWYFLLIDIILLRRWAVLQSTIFCISYKLGLLGILLKCLSVPFLIIPRTPPILGMIVVLRCHIFSVLFPGLCVYLSYILCLICYYLLALTYQLEGMFFFNIPLPLHLVYGSLFFCHFG